MRQFEVTGYKRSEIKKGKLEVLDENNKNIISQDITLDTNSNFHGSFDLPKDVSLGKLTFQFTS
jgi:hypothetical protein